MRRQLGIPIRVLLLVLPALLALPRPSSAAESPRKLYAWYVQSNNIDEPLDHAREHYPDALFVQVFPDWNAAAENLSFHDHYPKIAKTGAARERVQSMRMDLRAKVVKAKLRKVDFYLQIGELLYPPNLFEQYPEMRDPDHDAFWDFVADRANEVLTALPDAAGIIVYFDEVQHKIYELTGRQSVEDYTHRMLSTYLRVCRAHKKTLLASTFTNYYPERIETLARAIRRIPRSSDFMVLNWVCPSDWALFRVLNPAIGRVGGHPEILNFDFNGENWGEGVVPLGQLDFVAERLQQATSRGANIAGLSAWINWWLPTNLFGAPSEVDLAAAPRLLANPAANPAELYREWLARRYGKEAAPLLLPAFRDSFRVVTMSRQVLGFWTMEFPKSGFAPAYWIDCSLRANSPAVWNEQFRAVERGLFNPDERVLGDVLREKDEAMAMAQAAVEAVQSAEKFLTPEDYQVLQQPFRRAWDEARALRPYYALFFRYKIWAVDNDLARLPRMRELGQQLRRWADLFEKDYPKDPMENARRIREYVSEVDDLLAGKPLRRVIVTW